MRFGAVEVRPEERRLLVGGQPVALGARAFDVLLALVQHRDRVVTKAELLDLAWPGLVVAENNLTVQISTLRRVLGPAAISTVPAVGYRFTLPAAADDDVLQRLGDRLRPSLAAPSVRLLADWCAGTGAASSAPAPAAFADTARALVQQHGGSWDATGLPGLLQAAFGLPRDAAACAHALHAAARQLPGSASAPAAAGRRPAAAALRVVLVESDAVADAPALLQHTAPGQTWTTFRVSQALVHKLDGDLLDLGSDHRLSSPAVPRVFSLMPSLVAVPDLASAPPDQRLKPTLAVIPFSAYGPQPGVAPLGDILADQAIGALARSPALHVISRLSTVAFRDRAAPVAAIGRSLAADFVLSGRYWVAGGRMQLLVELARAASSEVVWSQTLQDEELAVLQPDSGLLQQLVGGVVQAVYAHELGQLRGGALPDLASHTLLLAGIHLLYRLSPRDFTLAREALETVHQRAPRHAAPLAWLARWHLFRVVQGWSDDREADGRLAQDHANRALDLDPDSALALTMLGNVHTSFLKDPARGEWLYDRALALNPNEPLAWLQKANARSFQGDGAAALAHARHAVQLSPLDPASHFYLTILAGAALTAQDYAQAIEAARAASRLNQTHLSTHRVLAIALAMSGRLDEARQALRQVLQLQPELTVARYIAQSPAPDLPLTRTFADALHRAGLPAGGGAAPSVH